jgi:hypothetical protein
MDGSETLPRPPKTRSNRCPTGNAAAGAIRPLTRADCLNLLLLAFGDLADRDDIHQADQRLKLVCRWIRAEAVRTAADPIFSEAPSAAAQSAGSAAAGRRKRAAAHHAGRQEWPML